LKYSFNTFATGYFSYGKGDVRRAKLYYLRERSGKSARIKEKV